MTKLEGQTVQGGLAGVEKLDPADFITRLFGDQLAAVAVFDRARRCVSWNDRMELVSRIARAEAVGRLIEDLYPELEARDRACLEAALAGERMVVRGRCFAVAEASERSAFDTYWSVLASGAGEIVGCVLVGLDRRHHLTLQERLLESEQRFKTMADCAPVLLWMAGTDGRCSFFNQTWLQFTGRPLEQETGWGWAEGVHPEDFQPCMDGYMEAFRARQEFELFYRLRRADGTYRWILDHGAPRFSPHGEFAGYIGSCIDVTDLKDAEDVARKTIDRLARTNAELESFGHAVSHDLQEPLRAIASYADLLAVRYRGKLDDKADSYIHFLVDGAKQMKQLVAGLLDYAQAKHVDASTFKPVKTDDAVARALSNLELTVKESGAEVTLGPLPVVYGSEMHLTQLFQNLLHNALKFKGSGTPWVRVSAEQEGYNWRFLVEDRGVGIDMRYASRLFSIFQRLHPRDETHGSGIGLALCQRIVELHGGRIWIESEPGQGAKVFFTLPAAAVE